MLQVLRQEPLWRGRPLEVVLQEASASCVKRCDGPVGSAYGAGGSNWLGRLCERAATEIGKGKQRTSWNGRRMNTLDGEGQSESSKFN